MGRWVLGIVAGLLLGNMISPREPLPETHSALLTPTAEETLIHLTNQDRVAVGVLPLQVVENLTVLAQLRADGMAARQELSHWLPGEQADPQQAQFTLILNAWQVPYTIAGENIARAPDETQAEQVEASFLASAAHRDNILLSMFTRIGVGIALALDGQRYYAVEFSREQQDNDL